MQTLSEHRRERGMSQSDLARELGLSGKSKGVISAIENGQPASPELALAIEDWSGGAVRAADLNPTVAAVRNRTLAELVGAQEPSHAAERPSTQSDGGGL